MDNEPGHKRKVFVLKVKTGSSLIPDEEVKPCAPLPSPLHSSKAAGLRPTNALPSWASSGIWLSEAGCQCSATGGNKRH